MIIKLQVFELFTLQVLYRWTLKRVGLHTFLYNQM